MKALIILILLSFNLVLAQDAEMVKFINLYRVKHGKNKLTVSEKLTKISVEQNEVIIADDSLSHSHKSDEIVVMGKNLPATDKVKSKFILFVKSLGLKYVEPKTEYEVITNVKLYCIYLFENSPEHKKILLGEHTNIGLDIVIRDIKFKSNEMILNGQSVSFKNIKSHYNVKFYCTVNF